MATIPQSLHNYIPTLMEFVVHALVTACEFFFFGLIMYMIFHEETPEEKKERAKQERIASRARGKAFLGFCSEFYSELSKARKRDMYKNKDKDKDMYKDNDTPEMADAKSKAITFMKENGIESPKDLLEGHLHIRQATSIKDLQTIAAQLVNTYGKRW
jgi:DNA invertase Pin-like site-specific DNA recombinase